MYHIRVDTDLTHDIVKYLVSVSTSALYAEETAKSGTHIHLFTTTEVSMATLRNHIRKEGFTGNKSYSISTVKDKIKTLAYIMKDGTFQIKNISTEDLELARKYDGEVKADIKKKTSKDIIAYLESQFHSLHNMGCNPDNVTAQVGQELLQYYLDNKIQIRRFQFQTIIDTLGCKHSLQYRINFIENTSLRTK